MSLDFSQNSASEEASGNLGLLGVTLLLTGVALGAAATLLFSASPGRQRLFDSMPDTSEWKDRLAQTLAKGREKVISAVEAHVAPMIDHVHPSPPPASEHPPR